MSKGSASRRKANRAAKHASQNPESATQEREELEKLVADSPGPDNMNLDECVVQ